jgi:hypothetical protein
VDIPRRISLVALLAGLSGVAIGQMRNPPPASIYSIGGTQLGPSFASIYSLPTNTFGISRACCGFTGVRGGNNSGRFVIPQIAGRTGGRHHHQGAAPIYGGVPYVYPYYGYGEVLEQGPDGSLEGAGTFDRPQSQQTEAEPPAPTVFERRPSQEYRAPGTRAEDSRYGEHYLDSRERDTRPSESPAPEPRIEDNVSTVLVFRDGHRDEIKNYAIMGTTLFVFAGSHRKIPLAELDLDATVRENDDRGIEFQVPTPRQTTPE